MGVYLDPSDLTPFADIDSAKAELMIEDSEALAMLAAPCLATDFEPAITEARRAAVKAILRGAILRWNDAGTGAFTQRQQTAGSFSLGESYDNRQVRKNMFWPTEITQLQDICKGDALKGGAFAVDTVGGAGGIHAEICSVNFGASYCSCGASIAGYPLYEV